MGKACERVGTVNGVQFTRELVAVITETTFKQCSVLGTDLELFAK